MSKPFKRVFEAPPSLTDTPPWFQHLLELWRPSGAMIEGADPGLRLAIRNGYLNFYRRGQSVASVGKGGHGYAARLHTAYLGLPGLAPAMPTFRIEQ